MEVGVVSISTRYHYQMGARVLGFHDIDDVVSAASEGDGVVGFLK